jgi:hypothetical protein
MSGVGIRGSAGHYGGRSVKILGLPKSLQIDTSHIKALHDRAEDVASRLGTDIPSSIERHMWSLPILEKMLDRIEELEKKCGSQCLQQVSCSVDSQSPGS